MSSVADQAPLDRCGQAWTQEENQILYDILTRRGHVSDAFDKIGRGQDAIKRKWRKILADRRYKKRRHNENHSDSEHHPSQTAHAIEPKDHQSQDSEEGCKSDANSSTDSISDISSSSPRASSRYSFGSMTGAACDECRQKHKRCGHRYHSQSRTLHKHHIKYKKQSLSKHNQRTKDQFQNTGSKEQHSGEEAAHTSDPRARIKILQESKDDVKGNSVALYQSKKPMKHAKFSQLTSNPVKLTANGKRRGRPPKCLHTSNMHRMGNPEVSSSVQTFGNPRRLTSKSVEDHEVSATFKKIILGDRSISHISDNKTVSNTNHTMSHRQVLETQVLGSITSSCSSVGLSLLLQPYTEECNNDNMTGRTQKPGLQRSLKQSGTTKRTANTFGSAKKDRKSPTLVLVDSHSTVRGDKSPSTADYAKTTSILVREPDEAPVMRPMQFDTFMLPSLYGANPPFSIRDPSQRPYSCVRDEPRPERQPSHL